MLIYYENADGADLFSTYVKKQVETTYGLTASSVISYSGTRSARFELRNTDPMNNNGTRAEISFPDATNLHRWYSFAVFFPSAQWQSDDADELINQWHQGGGVTPSITLGIKLDRYRLIVKETPTTKQTYDLGPIIKDEWNTFVFHIIHSAQSDGLIELWLNGVQVVDRTGINMYSTSGDTFHNPNWKLGVYKSAWNFENTSDVSIRVLHFDEVKLGNENSTYEEMTPTGSTPPPPEPPTLPDPIPEPTNLSVLSFTLINAATEGDVMTITNGQTIKLRQLKLSKINIRANISGSGSVKFELTGKQTKIRIDNESPYSLHGDDGDGNYYYGDWNPPPKGTYTLKATPYTGDDATGSAGLSKTITFTIAR